MKPDDLTHCGHGVSYKETCAQCDKIWADQVTLPAARKNIAQLLRFYSVKTLQELVLEQASHIEKLQAKVPRDNQPAFTRVREG